MRIVGHPNPLLYRGKDAPACLSSSLARDALTWVLDGGGLARTCAVEGAYLLRLRTQMDPYRVHVSHHRRQQPPCCSELGNRPARLFLLRLPAAVSAHAHLSPGEPATESGMRVNDAEGIKVSTSARCGADPCTLRFL